MSEITILIADDHPVVRDGVRAVLEPEGEFRVVGEAADGLEALRSIERLAPDIVIVDLMMPGLTGLEVTARVAKSFRRTRVVVLSMYASEAQVAEALHNGALAYVLKTAPAAELVCAVREAAAGRRFVSAPLRLPRVLAQARRPNSDAYAALTSRVREVLKLVAEGHTNSEAAARLFISPRTVESHRANLMRKLGLQKSAELVRYALERGIVAPTGP